MKRYPSTLKTYMRCEFWRYFRRSYIATAAGASPPSNTARHLQKPSTLHSSQHRSSSFKGNNKGRFDFCLISCLACFPTMTVQKSDMSLLIVDQGELGFEVFKNAALTTILLQSPRKQQNALNFANFPIPAKASNWLRLAL